jgi:protein-tyrosine phosphatase
MARPQGGDWLSDEMVTLRQMGADVLVSLLTHSEAMDLDLASEATAAEAAGIRFTQLSIPDMGVPGWTEYRELVDTLTLDLQADRHVVVHCRGGIGRSSLVAIGLLVNDGLSVAEACHVMSEARGVEVPETPEQRAWLDAVLGGY